MSEWIEWQGSNMPVAAGTPVQVRLRYGKEKYAIAGSGYATRWTYDGPHGDHDDILAYRIADRPDDALEFRTVVLAEAGAGGDPGYLDFITPDEIFDKGPKAVREWQEAKRAEMGESANDS